MNCVNFLCQHNVDDECDNPRVIYLKEECKEIQVEMDCLVCNLNEANKCPDCCKDWDEELEE